mgnify:CR=1 FL=1
MHRIVPILTLLLLCFAARADDPPRLEPKLNAEPAKAFAWTSEQGLRYTWVLPGKLAGTPHRNLIIICHGTGLDYRWGSANYKPGVFRPGDIVISVDGPTKAQNGTRLFMGNEGNAEVFSDFIVEMSKTFHAARVYLYGHSQGSFFVCYFAGVHPELLDGVVAHASGVWTWTAYKPEVAAVPIAFMHGTADPVVPYGQSVGGRDWYLTQGHPTIQLRRMDRYIHWPNGDRASECLDWCIGMKTDDPAEALAAAESMLRPKGVDQYAYDAPVFFSGAHDVLRRFEGKGARPFAAERLDKADAAINARARQLIEKVEAEGETHATRIRAQVKSPDDLKLDGRPWLGHLIQFREDFRGVESAEKLFTDLHYDELLKKHNDAARPLFEAWYGEGKPAEKFAAAITALPHCFLLDTLPLGFAETMEGWFKTADELGISGEARRGYAAVAQWRAGWEEGRKEYKAIWKAWKP